MKEKKITELLKRNANTVAVPNVLDNVKAATDLIYYKDQENTENTLQKKPTSWLSFYRFAWVPAVATIILIFIVVLAVAIPNGKDFDETVHSTVTLSTASSFEIKINSASQVIDISTDQQGQAVLQTISYKGKKFPQVASDLLKSCIDKGFILESDLDGTDLFSINAHDNKCHNQLQHHIKNSINSAKEHCKNGDGHNGH